MQPSPLNPPPAIEELNSGDRQPEGVREVATDLGAQKHQYPSEITATVPSVHGPNTPETRGSGVGDEGDGTPNWSATAGIAVSPIQVQGGPWGLVGRSFRRPRKRDSYLHLIVVLHGDGPIRRSRQTI